jgi:tRNA threonylcarbamoyladenosine biosynthesis protein TsaB
MMNSILAIDTSSAKCTVAVSTGDLLFQCSSESERQSAQRVLPMISEVLSNAKIKLAELDLIAVMAGPGSFTGLRIGIGVAQGLSAANSTPVIGLSSLAVMAMAAGRESVASQFLISEKAREGEVYFAAYRQSKSLGVQLVGQEQIAIPKLLKLAADTSKTDTWCAVGSGWLDREDIQNSLNCLLEGPTIEPEVKISDLCDLAKLRYAAGEALSADQLRPNYVKDRLDYG